MEKKLVDKSLILKEALSIPTCINNFVNSDINNYDEILKLIENKKFKFIVTIARGSSDCAALFGSYIFAKFLGLPSYSMPPSIITLEKCKFDFSEALVIIISQSGLSKDLIECEENSRKMGAKTLVISNNINSPIIKNSHYFFNINSGEEKSVAATKTFVMTLIVLLKMVLFFSNKKIIPSIEKLSEELISDSNNHWNSKAVDFSISTGFILGRGVGFALSNEISLKFKELCQEQIEPFSSAEVMHGPKSLIQNSFKLFTLSLSDPSGRSVVVDCDKLMEITNKVYEIKSHSKNKLNLTFETLNIPELDSIIMAVKEIANLVKINTPTIDKILHEVEKKIS